MSLPVSLSLSLLRSKEKFVRTSMELAEEESAKRVELHQRSTSSSPSGTTESVSFTTTRFSRGLAPTFLCNERVKSTAASLRFISMQLGCWKRVGDASEIHSNHAMHLLRTISLQHWFNLQTAPSFFHQFFKHRSQFLACQECVASRDVYHVVW